MLRVVVVDDATLPRCLSAREFPLIALQAASESEVTNESLPRSRIVSPHTCLFTQLNRVVFPAAVRYRAEDEFGRRKRVCVCVYQRHRTTIVYGSLIWP